MLWRYWAREVGSEPAVYSPVIRQEGSSAVLTTVVCKTLPPKAVVLGEFARSGAGGASVPFEARSLSTRPTH
ncbi:MAG: hypothetical protein MUF66_02170 [Gammaproteobacteria bacterium]|nr:hypothetical protein [Gammaproteobacteria bacterium]